MDVLRSSFDSEFLKSACPRKFREGNRQIELEGQNVSLMVRAKGSVEMQSGYGENTISNITARGN